MNYFEVSKNTHLTNDNIEKFDKLFDNPSPTADDNLIIGMHCLCFAARLPIPEREVNKLPISAVLNYINSHINNFQNSLTLFEHLVGMKIVSIDNTRADIGNCFISPTYQPHVSALKERLKILDAKDKFGQEPADD